MNEKPKPRYLINLSGESGLELCITIEYRTHGIMANTAVLRGQEWVIVPRFYPYPSVIYVEGPLR